MQTPTSWRQNLASCWVFPAAICWKLALIACWSLPPPANDAFWFDGAVVNWLRHGAYVNPSIVRMFPTSGAEIFGDLRPLYQAVVLGWMSVFGTSAQSSLWLHGLLVAAFALVVLAVLRRLGVPAAATNLGGLFLFGLTFHDRADGVAHVTGMLALWAWLRAGDHGGARWRWVAAAFAMLTFATSLHIGAMYAAILWAHALLRRHRQPLPWGPLLTMAVAPLALGTAVFIWWPKTWQGFTEVMLATPSFTGYRIPSLLEMLKVGRTAPAVLLIGAVTALLAWRRTARPAVADMREAEDCFIAVLVAALFATGATLFVVAADYVHVAAYPQVLVVALFAWLVAPPSGALLRVRWLRPALAACAALVAIRAVGLSTWGVACAVDVSRTEATRRVAQALARLPDGSEVAVSSAYLYALADERRVVCRHADWVGAVGEGPGAFQPACLVLTPYDYYRRYQDLLAGLVARGRVTVVSLEHEVRVPPPDSFPRWQRVVQHVSWAPVIVRVQWP